MIEIRIEAAAVFNVVFLSSSMCLVWFAKDFSYHIFRIKARAARERIAGFIGGVLLALVAGVGCSLIRSVTAWILIAPFAAVLGYLWGVLYTTADRVSYMLAPRMLMRTAVIVYGIGGVIFALVIIGSIRTLQFGLVDVVCGFLSALILSIPVLYAFQNNARKQQLYAVSVLIVSMTIALAAHLLSVN